MPEPGCATDRRLPLQLVTGFLGSGKTTLVNAVLRDPAFAGCMVIVNEFGEVGLDHLLVSSAQDQVVLLDSGCLCCAASGSLRDTLIDLFARRASGRVPAFDRIVVETSGLANPVPLVAALLGDSALVSRCRLQSVLTLVDAVAGSSTLERYTEARQQVALADQLLLTKGETVPEPAWQALYAQLRALNPHAPLALRHQVGAVGVMLEAAAGGLASAALAAPSAPLTFVRGPLRAQYAAEPDSAHGPAYRQIRTHSWPVPQALELTRYAEWVRCIGQRFGARLLRCKGLVRLDGELPWLVQGVQGFFAPPQRLGGWPPGVTQGFMVCITEAVPPDELSSAMALLLPDGAFPSHPALSHPTASA